MSCLFMIHNQTTIKLLYDDAKVQIFGIAGHQRRTESHIRGIPNFRFKQTSVVIISRSKFDDLIEMLRRTLGAYKKDFSFGWEKNLLELWLEKPVCANNPPDPLDRIAASFRNPRHVYRIHLGRSPPSCPVDLGGLKWMLKTGHKPPVFRWFFHLFRKSENPDCCNCQACESKIFRILLQCVAS